MNGRFLTPLVASLVLTAALAVMVMRAQRIDGARTAHTGMPLSVLGNSDSHSYQDRVFFPAGSALRGGTERARTFQWTEVIAQLRGAEVDQGAWAVRGTHPRLARVAGWFGARLRSPRKEDFAYNFAVSGARCESLAGVRGQVAQLLPLLLADHARWSTGVVVIRIGINDLGGRAFLDGVASGGFDTRAARAVEQCTVSIRNAMQAIRATHPTIRIVLVGIADNANWPPNLGSWRSAAEIAHLRTMHDAFDEALRQLAAVDQRARFFDDRLWFMDRWGGRGPDGEPAYKPVCLGDLNVVHSQGDELEHTIIADGHAGTVLNALWAQSLLQMIAGMPGATLTPVSDDEVARHVSQLRTRSLRVADGACPAPGDS